MDKPSLESSRTPGLLSIPAQGEGVGRVTGGQAASRGLAAVRSQVPTGQLGRLPEHQRPGEQMHARRVSEDPDVDLWKPRLCYMPQHLAKPEAWL